jgi:molecular chaperone DnaK (HSP70)
MENSITATWAAALLALALPSIASAQLSPGESQRAVEVARIHAKADAEERARENKTRRDSAESLCRSTNRQWDFANATCKPR